MATMKKDIGPSYSDEVGCMGDQPGHPLVPKIKISRVLCGKPRRGKLADTKPRLQLTYTTQHRGNRPVMGPELQWNVGTR
jgi:hypothetical protein